MSSSLPHNFLSKKQKGKRQVSPSSQSPPPIPKKAQTKIQASKDSPGIQVTKNASMQSTKNQTISSICRKVKHMWPEENLKLYSKKFLNKPIEHEYYVDKTAEVDLRVKFLKPFSNHKLMNFICLNKKFNPHHVNTFYCNIELTTTRMESRFKDRVVKFGYHDFTTHFGLKIDRMSISISKALEYDRISFVQSISKYVFYHLGMDNFHIS